MCAFNFLMTVRKRVWTAASELEHLCVHVCSLPPLAVYYEEYSWSRLTLPLLFNPDTSSAGDLITPLCVWLGERCTPRPQKQWKESKFARTFIWKRRQLLDTLNINILRDECASLGAKVNLGVTHQRNYTAATVSGLPIDACFLLCNRQWWHGCVWEETLYVACTNGCDSLDRRLRNAAC